MYAGVNAKKYFGLFYQNLISHSGLGATDIRLAMKALPRSDRYSLEPIMVNYAASFAKYAQTMLRTKYNGQTVTEMHRDLIRGHDIFATLRRHLVPDVYTTELRLVEEKGTGDVLDWDFKVNARGMARFVPAYHISEPQMKEPDTDFLTWFFGSFLHTDMEMFDDEGAPIKPNMSVLADLRAKVYLALTTYVHTAGTVFSQAYRLNIAMEAQEESDRARAPARATKNLMGSLMDSKTKNLTGSKSFTVPTPSGPFTVRVPTKNMDARDALHYVASNSFVSCYCAMMGFATADSFGPWNPLASITASTVPSEWFNELFMKCPWLIPAYNLSATAPHPWKGKKRKQVFKPNWELIDLFNEVHQRNPTEAEALVPTWQLSTALMKDDLYKLKTPLNLELSVQEAERLNRALPGTRTVYNPQVFFEQNHAMLNCCTHGSSPNFSKTYDACLDGISRDGGTKFENLYKYTPAHGNYDLMVRWLFCLGSPTKDGPISGDTRKAANMSDNLYVTGILSSDMWVSIDVIELADSAPQALKEQVRLAMIAIETNTPTPGVNIGKREILIPKGTFVVCSLDGAKMEYTIPPEIQQMLLMVMMIRAGMKMDFYKRRFKKYFEAFVGNSIIGFDKFFLKIAGQKSGHSLTVHMNNLPTFLLALVWLANTTANPPDIMAIALKLGFKLTLERVVIATPGEVPVQPNSTVLKIDMLGFGIASHPYDVRYKENALDELPPDTLDRQLLFVPILEPERLAKTLIRRQRDPMGTPRFKNLRKRVSQDQFDTIAVDARKDVMTSKCLALYVYAMWNNPTLDAICRAWAENLHSNGLWNITASKDTELPIDDRMTSELKKRGVKALSAALVVRFMSRDSKSTQEIHSNNAVNLGPVRKKVPPKTTIGMLTLDQLRGLLATSKIDVPTPQRGVKFDDIDVGPLIGSRLEDLVRSSALSNTEYSEDRLVGYFKTLMIEKRGGKSSSQPKLNTFRPANSDRKKLEDKAKVEAEVKQKRVDKKIANQERKSKVVGQQQNQNAPEIVPTGRQKAPKTGPREKRGETLPEEGKDAPSVKRQDKAKSQPVTARLYTAPLPSHTSPLERKAPSETPAPDSIMIGKHRLTLRGVISPPSEKALHCVADIFVKELSKSFRGYAGVNSADNKSVFKTQFSKHVFKPYERQILTSLQNLWAVQSGINPKPSAIRAKDDFGGCVRSAAQEALLQCGVASVRFRGKVYSQQANEIVSFEDITRYVAELNS